MDRKIISYDLEVMGGTACFSGRRVPLQTLLDYLEAGDSIDEFLEGFPTVTREMIVAFLDDVDKQMRDTPRNH